MKRAFILFAYCIILFSACNKDDSEPLSNSIVGDWVITRSTLKDCDDPMFDSSESVPCTSTDCVKFNFESDGTFAIQSIEDGDLTTEHGTYTVADGKLTLCDTPTICEDPIIFSVTGATMTMTFPDILLGCTLVIICGRI
jgi:Lipocalin-like domain